MKNIIYKVQGKVSNIFYVIRLKSRCNSEKNITFLREQPEESRDGM